MSIPLTPRGRAGSLLVEAMVTCTGLAAIGLIAAGVAVEARDDRRGDAREAALETAQNLLARVRRHDAADLPPGWTSERRVIGPDAVAVTVRGAGVTLATVLPTTSAPKHAP